MSHLIISRREAEVLDLLCEGLGNKQIAHRLSISDQTVKNHLTSIYNKTGRRDRVCAALWWHGLTLEERTAMAGPPEPSLEDLIERHIRRTQSGCWIWDGPVSGAAPLLGFKGEKIKVRDELMRRAGREVPEDFRPSPVCEGRESRYCVNHDHQEIIPVKARGRRISLAAYAET